MNLKGVFQAKQGLAVGAGILLILSIGLEVYTAESYGQVSLATLLFALYLASWALVLGAVGFVAVFVWWLAESRGLVVAKLLQAISARQMVLGVGVVPVRVLRALTCRFSS